MDNSSHSKSVVLALWFSGYWEWVERADFRTLTQRNQKPGCLELSDSYKSESKSIFPSLAVSRHSALLLFASFNSKSPK